MITRILRNSFGLNFTLSVLLHAAVLAWLGSLLEALPVLIAPENGRCSIQLAGDLDSRLPTTDLVETDLVESVLTTPATNFSEADFVDSNLADTLVAEEMPLPELRELQTDWSDSPTPPAESDLTPLLDDAPRDMAAILSRSNSVPEAEPQHSELTHTEFANTEPSNHEPSTSKLTTSEPRRDEPPANESPTREPPKVEPPKSSPQNTAASVVEQSKSEPPQTSPRQAEQPKTEAIKTESPNTESAKTESAKTEQLNTEKSVPPHSSAPAKRDEAEQKIPAAAAASPSSRAADGSEVDDLPQPLTNPAPQYPPEALAAGVEGRVVLQVNVGTDGTVVSARVYRSSGVLALDKAALEAVRRWRFSPARRAGFAVPTDVAVPVRFVIQKRSD